MKNKKVCHITTVHPVFDIRIFHKECKTLALSNYNISLIVQNDKSEIVDGIEIVAIPRAKNRIDRFFRLNTIALRRAIKQNAAIYHFHDPELIILGLILKLFGKKVIYDVHEDVPSQILNKYWIPNNLRIIISKIVELMELFSARIFNCIVCATPKIASRFPCGKTLLIQNFPEKNGISPDEKIPYERRPSLVGYFGDISEVRGIFEMIKALELLPDDTLILRVTCDTPKDRLAFPRKFPEKARFLSLLHRRMEELNTWQGRLFLPSS